MSISGFTSVQLSKRHKPTVLVHLFDQRRRSLLSAQSQRLNQQVDWCQLSGFRSLTVLFFSQSAGQLHCPPAAGGHPRQGCLLRPFRHQEPASKGRLKGLLNPVPGRPGAHAWQDLPHGRVGRVRAGQLRVCLDASKQRHLEYRWPLLVSLRRGRLEKRSVA